MTGKYEARKRFLIDDYIMRLILREWRQKLSLSWRKLLIAISLVRRINLLVGLYHLYKLQETGICFARFSDHKIIYANPVLLEWLEYSEEELREFPFFDIVHPDDLIRTQSKADELGLKPGDPVYGFENRYLTKSGEYITLRWTTYVIWGWYVGQVEKVC